MPGSTGNEPKTIPDRPTYGPRVGITADKPSVAKGKIQANKSKPGVAHTPMKSDTPSGKGQKR